MSTLSINEAKNKRKTIKSMTTRIKTFFENSEPDQLSRFELIERNKKLSSLWEQYDQIQTRIEALEFANLDGTEHDETALHKQHSDERAGFETQYFNLVARLEETLHTLELRENREITRAQNSVTQTRNNTASSQLRLPKIELPSFSGKCEDWYAFYDTFEKLINANTDLSEIQKFHYLRSSLKGEAAEVIKAFEITTENYKEAWELLIERYDNRRRIVQGHVKSLFELPPIAKENHRQLRTLLDGVCKHLRALKALKRPVDAWDDLVIHLVISKLDATTKREWETSRSDSSIPNFKQLKDFLLQRCLALEAIASKSTDINVSLQKSKRLVANAAIANLVCKCCKENHFLYQCESFKKLPVEERFKIVKDSHLCINCLKTSNHQAKKCPSSSCRKCQKTHNTLLHFNSTTVQDNQNPSSVSKEAAVPVVTQCSLQNPSNVLLSTSIIHVYDSKGKAHACRALLDSGSQLNFVTEDFAKKLHLNKQSMSMPILGIAEGSFEARNSVNLVIQSRFNAYREQLNCIILPKITQRLPQDFVHPSQFKIPSHIQLADPNFNVPSDIDLLIGAEVFWQLTCIGQIKKCSDHPTLQKTKLGWILSGCVVNSQKKKNRASCHLATLEVLNETISKFWQVENNYYDSTNGYSAEELACETLFQETTVRNHEGRFVVRLPVKDDVISQLGESRQIAERQFFALERRLSKQPEIYDEYRRFMREYEDLNHMCQIEDTEDRDNGIHYYLPHHAVIKNTSTTTKLRVVFNASCKTQSGISLNDALLIGPTLQQDLFSILSRFRTFLVAIIADVAKMYRQVIIDPSQRCLQRIVWRNTPQEILRTLELFTVTYGNAAAAFLAIRSMLQLAKDGAKSYPLGAKIILEDSYVDDVISGASTIEEALETKNQAIALLQSGGFELRKWSSNSPLLRDNNSESDKMIDSHSEHYKTRALGVSWNCDRDTFNFAIYNNHQPLTKITKRGILSRIAIIFDPLGLLGPVVVIGKLIMQELWLLKIDWDESIPTDLNTKWRNYERQLQSLSNLEIPRKIVVHKAKLIELHGFSDASQQAYGACVYLRSSANVTDEFEIHLIASKSRVAPVKSLSIPRLELCGALLLTQLMDKLKKCLGLTINASFYWTDSRIVIQWLSSSSRNWTTFVANRVGAIQSLTSIENWHHISGKENPADPLSRGVMPECLSQLEVWWHGPKWLQNAESEWPVSTADILDEIPDKRESSKSGSHVVTLEVEFDIFDRYSSYERLIRVFAICLRFIKAIKRRGERLERDPSNKQVPLSSCDELDNAKLTLVKILQRRYFKKEIEDISKFGVVNKKSSVLKLSPFLDNDEVLRVGGRLRHASIPYNAKHPILLPGRHNFTRLIVIHEHKRLLHAGAQMTLSSIHQNFWPCSGRSVVRNIISKCVVCFRNAPKLSNTLMGNLPQSRVNVLSRPFEKCGIDYAGPMYYKEGQRKNSRSIKCFIAIFVCFATKAVHIELVGDLTTEAFLNAFKRFISRRGRPSDVYSDNGLNFVGAERQLIELYEMLNNEESRRKIMDNAIGDRINWHFIPPRAPHMGGLWEAAVKAAKFHIKRIIGEASLRYDEFLTLLAQIEAILNSRPLTPLSADPNDLSVLTAAHFLIGCPITSYPEPNLEDLNTNRLSRWQRVEQLRQNFWKRWTREYLHNCQQRSKWNTIGPPVTVGQLVILREDNLPPLVWTLGRIEEIYPGSDNIIRTVLVRTAKGIYKRPMTKICVLPVD